MKIFYQLLKWYVDAALHLFFNKIKVVGKNNIPVEGPVLFLPNHQNALLDALLIVTQISRKTNFVARADVFKKPLIKKLLSYIYMMPIYRIRDGRNALSRNEEIFESCAQILGKGECLVIFPEGNHSFMRRLRPLSKGFTRIIFKTLEYYPEANLTLVPVGLNYTRHQKFGSSVSIYFGEGIQVQHPLENNANTIQIIKTKVADKLKKLITHIDDEENYDTIFKHLQQSNPDYLNPFETNLRLKELPLEARNKTKAEPFYRKFFRVLARINYFIPLAIWQRIKSTIKDPVMEGSIKFSVGITAFPIILILQTAALGIVAGSYVAIIYLVLSLFLISYLGSINKHGL